MAIEHASSSAIVSGSFEHKIETDLNAWYRDIRGYQTNEGVTAVTRNN